MNDHLVGKCLATICAQIVIGCDIRVNKELQGMSELPIIQCSTRARADVVLCLEGTDFVVFVGEVNSSPMKETEFKAVYFGIEFLRLARCEMKN